MNTVAIDPSLASTAITINGKKFSFVNEKLALTKKGELTKWFKLAEPYIDYTLVNYNTIDDYSENEVRKLDDYHYISSLIEEKIVKEIDKTKNTKVFIEGYSYSSTAGPLIDLVTFSTVIRSMIWNQFDGKFTVISPKSLKLSAAKFTYKPIIKGKKKFKYEYRNNDGVSGGKFQKVDMLKALIDNDSLQDPYVEFLREYKKELTSSKNIPKPLDDINDSYLMYLINLQ